MDENAATLDTTFMVYVGKDVELPEDLRDALERFRDSADSADGDGDVSGFGAGLPIRFGFTGLGTRDVKLVDGDFGPATSRLVGDDYGY